ncbi:MAG TPA: FAD-dependent oxidoreductase, partial [Magnetospirillaceae bacterium]|nr:FAD-dependent oxidoreductase [Magnetospirillaceae bacterium]
MSTYVIVGGVAGGASAAARLRRLDERAEIILLERGDHISYASCGLPYYAGGSIADRSRLFVMTPGTFRAWLAVDVRTGHEAVSIDREARSLSVLEIRTGRVYAQPYDALILSPGAEPIQPPIPGVDGDDIFTLRSVPDADKIKAFLVGRRPERAVVVGGGFIGLEMAENLQARGSFVTIVEALDQVMAPLDFEMAAMVHRHLRDRNIELYLSDPVTSFIRRGSRTIVRLGSGAELSADLVLLSIGVRPDTRLARDAGLALAPNGAILVDERMRTDDPAIYALGDACAFRHPLPGIPFTVPLAGPANKQARIAADAIVSGNAGRPWKGSIAVGIAKVFDLTAASAGASEKALSGAGIRCASLIVHGNSHAGYYPGAMPLTLKAVYDPESGRLLGAQAVGYDGVDKRIDVLSEAVRRGARVTELAEFEQAYSPPFSSAKDPVNILGMAADNVFAGLTRPISWREVGAAVASGAFLLDVRTREEYHLGTIPGAVNIPNDEIRSRMEEIPRDRAVVIFCGVGLRGYLVERILRQKGWTEVGNLSGGYKTWELASERQNNPGTYRPGLAGIQGSLRIPADNLLAATWAEGSGMPEGLDLARNVSVRVDACGLSCPGPILRLKSEIDRLPPGARVIISATDPGFARDARSWCAVTGNTLQTLEESGGVYTAAIEKTVPARTPSGAAASPAAGATFIVFSDDMDKALAAFVLANGAAAVGKAVTLFFTFWGLSVIKRNGRVKAPKDFMG